MFHVEGHLNQFGVLVNLPVILVSNIREFSESIFVVDAITKLEVLLGGWKFGVTE